MEFEKLITTRKSKGISQQIMASKVGMEQTTYSLSFIHDDEWEKFAKALGVSVETIKEEHPIAKNENCNFYDQSIGIQYVNVPKDMYDLLMQHFKKMNVDIEE